MFLFKKKTKIDRTHASDKQIKTAHSRILTSTCFCRGGDWSLRGTWFSNWSYLEIKQNTCVVLHKKVMYKEQG